MAAQTSNRATDSFPSKRPRTEAPAKKSIKFTSVADIRNNLHLQNEALTEAITGLRNQLTVWPTEPPIPPNDERLLLVQRWMESSPGAHDILALWDGAGPRQTSLIAVLLSLLSSVVTLLSSHYTFHALGQPIVKALLTPVYMRRLNSYIGGSHNELIIVTIKLFNVLSSFAGGRERKSVLEGFAWEIKSLPKLLNMRRKTKGEETVDPLVKPDIRTLYILFLLSFVDVGTASQVKSTFIEQHRDAFLAIFKGLNRDHSSVIRKILEICWAGIWSDPKVKRTLKIGLFSEQTIAHLLKLYERVNSDSQDADYVPADLVHHFLLAICTHPGTGICFKDRGWYPREPEGGDDLGPKDGELDVPNQKGGKIYNKILGNILKTLKVNEDSRQQELATKIMTACPELVAGYWSGAALTLEPRLSSKWITNIAFFGSIISLPIPTTSLYLPNTTLYQPTPPPLSTTLENTFPSVNTKAHFSKGLQAPSGLVQHCTALGLAKCLGKYEAVLELFRNAQVALEEDTEEGQWSKRRRDLEREVRRRVPEFQVIVAFSQQKEAPGKKSKPNQVGTALLAESAQRLLWMYHRCLPSVVAEVRFDVGKLLQNFSVRGDEKKDEMEGEEGEDELPGAAIRLHHVQQLHVLKLLKEGDQFVWAGKAGSASHSNLYVLLKALTTIEIPAIRTALTSLLHHILSESIIFQEDPHEPQLWLQCLPRTRRSHGAESPDGTPLLEEADVIITFLDDCVLRCLKTPYRYIEEMYALTATASTSGANTDIPERLDMCHSPLLMTVLEQLDAKVGNKSISPSGILALASFVRKLVFLLSSKVMDLKPLRVFADKVDVVLKRDRLFPNDTIVTNAIRREVDLLQRCLDVPTKRMVMDCESESVEAFLSQVEDMQIPVSKTQQIIAASELIDWLRLVDQSLSASQVGRLAHQVSKFHPPALRDLVEYLDPEQSNLWDGLDVVSDFHTYLAFPWLYLHAREEEILDEKCRFVLSDSVFTTSPSLVDVTRVVRLIMHRLSPPQSEDAVTGLLQVLARIVKTSFAVLSPMDFSSLKAVLFEHQGVLKEMFLSGTSVQGTKQLLEVSLVATSVTDRLLVSDIGRHWMDSLKLALINDDSSVSAQFALLWVNYVEPEELFDLLDSLTGSIDGMASPSVLEIVKHVLEAIRSIAESESKSESFLIQCLPQLLSLRSILPESRTLEHMVATAIEATIPVGLDGSSLISGDSESFDIVPVIRRSTMRWPNRGCPLPVDFQIHQFLSQETWSEGTVKIIRGWLYKHPSDREAFASWMSSQDCLGRSNEYLVPIIHAFLDTTASGCGDISSLDRNVLELHFSRLVSVVLDEGILSTLRAQAETAICQMISLTPTHTTSLLQVLATTLDSTPSASVTAELVTMAAALHKSVSTQVKSVVTSVVDQGMQWAIRQFSEDMEDDEGLQIIEELIQLVELASLSKPQTVETLLGVVVQNRLSKTSALKLASSALRTAALKPLIVNRHLQSIIQHPQFFKICTSPSQELSPARDAVIDLLHSLFHLHPVNTCQVTHVEPFVRIYRGTLSNADLKVLSILQLFESTRKLSVSVLFSRWSSTTGGTESSSSLDAIQSLDSAIVLRTCLHFPRWRRLEDQAAHKTTAHEAQLYDPVFLMLLFGQMLADSPPSSAFAWIEMFRTNVVSLLFRALSSKDGQIRDLALCQVVALWKHMETADLQEKPHVLYILNLLKDTLPPPTPSSDESCRRLPSYTTLLLLHALRGVFYPSNFIYPLTARFLLQRPELDTSDVPMLYGMLYSSSDDWKKERAWIIRFLVDGMMSSGDWRVLKRRHTWDLLASLFQSDERDSVLRQGVLEVLANLTCNSQATMSLILKSALLSWIEMQLLLSTVERVEWFKILENVLVSVDSHKLENSLGGQWRSTICRCLTMLLDEKTTPPSDFPHAAPVILRLSLLEGSELPGFPELLKNAIDSLKKFETKVSLEITQPSRRLSANVVPPPSPPHFAHGLHERCSLEVPVATWGSCVEMLWRAAMTDERTSFVWDELTSRMLLWRGIVGPRKSAVGEWARIESVRSVSV